MRASQVRRWHDTSIERKTATGFDAYGAPAFASAFIRGRIVRKARRARTPEGEEITSSTQVQTLDAIAVGDVLSVDGIEYRVRAVDAATSLRGGVTIREAML